MNLNSDNFLLCYLSINPQVAFKQKPQLWIVFKEKNIDISFILGQRFLELELDIVIVTWNYVYKPFNQPNIGQFPEFSNFMVNSNFDCYCSANLMLLKWSTVNEKILTLTQIRHLKTSRGDNLQINIKCLSMDVL